LVSIPVELYPATRSGGVSLRMLSLDGTPLARRYVCPDDDKEVGSEDLVRGYEFQKGEYVVVTDEELESVEPDKSRDIDLQLFVAASEIDARYFMRSYFLAPAGESTKAYHLLTSVMEQKDRAGIATFVMRDKEYLVAIMAQDGMMVAHALRFHDELRSPEDVALPREPDEAKTAAARFAKLIESHSKDKFDLDALKNEAAEDLRKLAEKKAKKDDNLVKVKDAEPEEEHDAEVIDLMAVLKRSLAGGAGDGAKSGASKPRGPKRSSR
jgi:DNA end-binding protein Ku